MRPLISIITVVYNAHQTVEETIRSVKEQDFNEYEYLIIDGGSTDGTVDLIRRHEASLSTWISEPDGGIYDAMNKGLDRATGEWVYFLGADDRLEPGILSRIAPYLKSPVAVVFGKILFDDGLLFRSFLGFRTLLQNTLHHQSAFYHHSLFTSFRYSTQYRIIADYELNLRIYLDRLPYRFCPLLIARCAVGGASSQMERSLEETNEIRSKYVKNPVYNRFLSESLRLYYFQKRVRAWLVGRPATA